MLNAFEWTEKYKLGIPEIDTQHQELIRRVNCLVLAVNDEKSSENIRQLIYFLEEYIVHHFFEEEQLMEREWFPDVARHREIHIGYVARVRSLAARLDHEDITPDLVAELNRLLLSWLSGHIDVEDRLFAKYMLSHRG